MNLGKEVRELEVQPVEWPAPAPQPLKEPAPTEQPVPVERDA